MNSTLKGDTLSKSVTPIDSLDRRLKAKLDVEPRPFGCPFLGAPTSTADCHLGSRASRSDAGSVAENRSCIPDTRRVRALVVLIEPTRRARGETSRGRLRHIRLAQHFSGACVRKPASDCGCRTRARVDLWGHGGARDGSAVVAHARSTLVPTR